MKDKSAVDYLSRQADHARTIQPPINANPPIGVTAPSQRSSVRTRRYKLPLNTAVPTVKHHPANLTDTEGNVIREASHAAAKIATTWYNW